MLKIKKVRATSSHQPKGRRGKNIIERLNTVPKKQWKTIRIERSANKKAKINVLDEMVFLKGYNKEIRQISITGHGK